MRALIIVPATVLLAAAGAAALCAAAGWTLQSRPMLLAAGICLISSIAAAVPRLLTRSATQASIVPAGLTGTVIHLFATLALAAPFFLSTAREPASFTYWLFAFYAVSLAALVVEFVRAVRSAPVAAAPGNRD